MKEKKVLYLIIVLAVALILINLAFLFFNGNLDFLKKYSVGSKELNASEFSSVVDNKYFTLTPGTKYIYEGMTQDGLERGETLVTEEKKVVNGIETTVVLDKVFLEGELIEETYDWYAQDSEGNVWYFGEDSKEYENGEVVSTQGSWEAGMDGAVAGIIMKADPLVGEDYRQEYSKGVAEDKAEIIALGETVETSYKTFSDCLKTKDWNSLESGTEEYKYYCPEAGNVVLETKVESGEKSQLTGIQKS